MIGTTKNPLSRGFVNRLPPAETGLFPIISRPSIDLAINGRSRPRNGKYHRATINRAYYANDAGIVTLPRIRCTKKSTLEGETSPLMSRLSPLSTLLGEIAIKSRPRAAFQRWSHERFYFGFRARVAERK